jgi:hypothetical protein
MILLTSILARWATRKKRIEERLKGNLLNGQLKNIATKKCRKSRFVEIMPEKPHVYWNVNLKFR